MFHCNSLWCDLYTLMSVGISWHKLKRVVKPGFFPWGAGGPPIRRKFCQFPPSTLVPVFGPRLVPPQRRFVPKNLKNIK